MVFPCASGASLRKVDVVPKKGQTIKDPLANSAGELVEDAKPPEPEGAEYDYMYVPRSPPARKDMSPTDPYEYISDWEGDAAKYIDNFQSDEGQRFEGITCEGVCAACAVFAAQNIQGPCACYADCKMGECGIDSVLPHIGWSNNEVTSPRTLWSAQCNHGAKNCEAQCMKDELKKQLKECEQEKGNPADCYNRLREIHKPLPHDARRQVHYCIRDGMERCDTFLNVPKEKEWTCYDEAAKCDGSSERRLAEEAERQAYMAPTPFDSSGMAIR